MDIYLEALEELASGRRMTQFLVTKKDGEKVVMGFIDLRAFLEWVRSQRKVVIDAGDGKNNLMLIEVSHGN